MDVFTAHPGNRDVLNIEGYLESVLFQEVLQHLYSLWWILLPQKILVFSPRIKVTLGTEYLKVVVFSYVITAVNFAYSFILKYRQGKALFI